MSFFHCLGHAKESVQVQGTLKHFATITIVYGEGLLAPRPTPKLQAKKYYEYSYDLQF
jgi:hypothetical protein